MRVTLAVLALLLPLVLVPAPAASADLTECMTFPPCGGIRPGGMLSFKFSFLGVFSDFAYCSMAFIVTDGDRLYVSTAGHCVDEELDVPTVGERVSAYGVPGSFGTVVHQWCEGGALNGGCSPGTDFALILIDEEKESYVDPSMPKFGAPTGGMFTAHDDDLRQVQHFGWGIGIGDVGGSVGIPTGNPATQGRVGLLLVGSEENFAIIESAAISGDSGSGVLVMGIGENLHEDDETQALGVLTHVSVGGLAIVQRLDASLAHAGEAMGKTFTLVSS